MKRGILVMLSLGLFAFALTECNSNDMKDYEPSPYTDTDFSENVKLTVKETDITTDMKEITLVFENLTDENYIFGQQPFLEVKHNNEWIVVPYKTGIGWDAIAYGIDKNDKTEYTFIFSHSYDKLPQGKYRIIKKIWSEETKKDEYTVAEFIIK